MLSDLFSHPRRFAAKVGVIGAGLYAGSNKIVAVKLIWAHRSEHDFGARAHGFEISKIIRIGDHKRRIGRCTDFIANGFELFLRAPGHCPFGPIIAPAVMLVEIFCDEASGVAGCAVDDDIKFGVAHVTCLLETYRTT